APIISHHKRPSTYLDRPASQRISSQCGAIDLLSDNAGCHLIPSILRSLYHAAMGLLYDVAYLAAAPVALPLLAGKSLRTGKYRTGLASRMGTGPDIFPDRKPHEKLLMLHCVSVGELNSVSTLV